MKILIKLIICLLFTKFVFADVPHIFAMHINGISTTKKEASNHAASLEDTVPNIQSNMLTFGFVWNPTGDDADKNFLINLHDVIKQKFVEQNKTMDHDDFTRYWIKANKLPNYSESSVEYQNLKSQIAQKYKERFSKIAGMNFDIVLKDFHDKVPMPFRDVVRLLQTKIESNPTTILSDPASINSCHVKTQLEKFIESINANQATIAAKQDTDYSKSKNMVLFLPHSQGNLYANALYKYLIYTQRFPFDQIAIYGIATPTHSIFGDTIFKHMKQQQERGLPEYAHLGKIDSYITSDRDLVIEAVRNLWIPVVTAQVLLGPGILPPTIALNLSTLPSNFTIPEIKAFPLGHNLINVYLSNPDSKNQIAKMISLHLSRFQTTIASKLSKFDLRFAINNASNECSSSATDDGALNNTKGNICKFGKCIDSVLYFKLDWPEIKKEEKQVFYFPRSSFESDTYYLLGTPKHHSSTLLLPNNVETVSNSIYYSNLLQSENKSPLTVITETNYYAN